MTIKRFDDDQPRPFDAEVSADLERKMNAIKSKITGWKNLPDSMKESIFNHFASFQEHQPPKRVGECDIAVDFAGLKLAIRDSDLNFVEALAAGSLAITTYLSAVTKANPEVMAVSLVFSAFTLYRRLVKKVTILNDEQYKILMTLKASGPSTVAQLAETLGGLHIFGNNLWTEERTLKALKDLESVHLGDGTVQALVSKASDDRWAANGI